MIENVMKQYRADVRQELICVYKEGHFEEPTLNLILERLGLDKYTKKFRVEVYMNQHPVATMTVKADSAKEAETIALEATSGEDAEFEIGFNIEGDDRLTDRSTDIYILDLFSWFGDQSWAAYATEA